VCSGASKIPPRSRAIPSGPSLEISQNKLALDPALFRISNHHTGNSGQPPVVDGDEPDKYHGYFANRYGEQAVFIYDYGTHEASVRMGDAGWDNVHRVVDGRVEGVILNEEEAAWIRACWLATAKAFRSPSYADSKKKQGCGRGSGCVGL